MAVSSVPRSRSSLGSRFGPSRWFVSLHLSACDHVGSGVRTLGRPLVHNDGRISIGRDVVLRSLGTPVRLTATSSGSIALGDEVVVDTGASLFSESAIRVEAGVVVGPNALICDRDENGRAGEIAIGARARIGAGARILGPCRIGAGAVVLARSVVRGDVPAGGVVRPEAPEAPPVAIPRKQNGVSNGAGHAHADSPRAASAGAGTTPGVAPRRVRATLVADFTIDELAAHLAASDSASDSVSDLRDFEIDPEVAPFDQVVPSLISLAALAAPGPRPDAPDASSRAGKPDLAVVWTLPDRACPSFGEMLRGGPPDLDKIFSEVDAFASLIHSHTAAARFLFVPSWLIPPSRRGVGLLELRGQQTTHVLMRMNLRLADALAKTPNVFVLDAQRWLAVASDGGVDPKLWFAGKVAFTSDVFAEAARDIRAGLRAALGLSRKLVVVDLDDTMWGGIVGDVGWEGLRLGGHDPNGEAFVQFQRQLVGLTKRGIALAVVSKNEESTALDAMQRHSEMLIRPSMLAAFRINWRDKAQNIVEIANELNLGLQSVVFLDDNPIERGRVREALPEVYVPEWPLDPTHYPRALDSLRCFDAAHISAEDVERNAMYATERERTSARDRVSSFDEWLATLDLKIHFERVGGANVARAAQLLNKTNQMNLRTRRLSESELVEWSRVPGHEVWTIHVSDRFGHAGLTGILSLARAGDEVRVEDYVLSCRVMGRRVEETMIWAAKHRASALGGKTLIATPFATAKNKPCIDFFARSGLGKSSDGYAEAVGAGEPPPALVAVDGLE
jgi:FkbH-like protein